MPSGVGGNGGRVRGRKIERYVDVKCQRCRSHPRFPRDGLVRALEAPDWYFCVGCGTEFYATS